MAYVTIAFREPVPNQWNDMVAAAVDTRINYMQILNLSTTDELNLVVGVKNASTDGLTEPTGTGVATFGAVGSTKYEYLVTAVNALGETTYATIVTISNGPLTLDATNYHKVTWNAVAGAQKYRIYCRVNNNTVYGKEVDNPTVEQDNKGDWPVTSNWPWINLTDKDGILVYEKLAPNTALQMDVPLKIAQGWRLQFYTTGPISVFACGEA